VWEEREQQTEGGGKKGGKGQTSFHVGEGRDCSVNEERKERGGEKNRAGFFAFSERGGEGCPPKNRKKSKPKFSGRGRGGGGRGGGSVQNWSLFLKKKQNLSGGKRRKTKSGFL